MRRRGVVVGALVAAGLVIVAVWLLRSDRTEGERQQPSETRAELVTSDVAFSCKGLPLELGAVRVKPSPKINTWAFDLRCVSDTVCSGTATFSVTYRSEGEARTMLFDSWLSIEPGDTLRLTRQQRSAAQIEAIESIDIQVIPGASNPLAGA
jgi:hypothetical protein